MNRHDVHFPYIRLRSFSWKTLLDIVVIALLMAYVFAGKNSVPFHGDESISIAGSADYCRIVHKREFELVTYQGPGNQHHPPVLPYQLNQVSTGSINMLTIGMAWHMAGMSVSDLNGSWIWNASEKNIDYNAALGNMPDYRLLNIARIPSTIFLALSIGVIFGILWLLTRSRPAAYSASIIYTLSPAVLVNGRRAMQEGALLFFTLLTIYFAIYFILARAKHCRGKMFPLKVYIIIGVTGGFAMAGKHTAGLVVAVVIFALCAAPFIEQFIEQGSKLNRDNVVSFVQHVCNVIGAGLLSLAVFFLLMPIWWSWVRIVLPAIVSMMMFALGWRQNTRAGLICAGPAVLVLISLSIIYPDAWLELVKPFKVMGETRQWLMEIQSTMTATMQNSFERIVFMIKQAFFANAQYFEISAWAGQKQIVEQIANYEGKGMNGHGGGIFPGIAIFGLFVAGTWKLLTRRIDGIFLLITLWILVPVLVLVFANPFPWQRYYILLHAPIAVLCGLGVQQIWCVFYRHKKL